MAIPAQLTRPWIDPKQSTANSTKFLTSSSDVTSQITEFLVVSDFFPISALIQLPPSSSISLHVALPRPEFLQLQ